MMILFPAMLVGSHLLTAALTSAMAQVPELNFAPICRDRAGEELGPKNDSAICMQDEAAARSELTKKWSEFDASDRASCIRLSTQDHTASYVEVLTCLEMNRDARKLRKGADAGISAPEPRERAASIRDVPVERHDAPPAPAPPAAQPGILQVLCLPGLKDILPACRPSAGYR